MKLLMFGVFDSIDTGVRGQAVHSTYLMKKVDLVPFVRLLNG